MVKVVVERKEAVWKEVWDLEMRLQKEDVWRFIRKKRERLKGPYTRAKRK